MAKNQTPTSRQVPSNAQAQADGAAAVAGGDEGGRRSAPKPQAPKTYRALARGYADGRIVEAGELFTTSVPKGEWMEEVKAAGGKSERLSRAVDDLQSPMSDDADLSTFSLEALQAEALRFGLTNAKGLSKDDLITALRARYDEERAR